MYCGSPERITCTPIRLWVVFASSGTGLAALDQVVTPFVLWPLTSRALAKAVPGEPVF